MNPELVRSVRALLVGGTDGNPLALLEVASLLDEQQRIGAKPLPEPVPSGRSIERAYLRRLRSLPEDAQQLLLLMAASDTGDLEEISGAARTLGLEPARLGVIEQRGLVTLERNRVTFRHPLLRSAVYHSADTPARRAAHRAMAVVAFGAFAEDRQAWHAAAGAEARDESIAAALEQSALRVRQRVGHGAATDAFERAADLTPESQRRADRLVQAASDAQVAGRFAEAERLIDSAVALTDDPLVRADLHLVLGRCMLWRVNTSETVALLQTEANRVESIDAARAATLLADVVAALFIAGQCSKALEVARRAHAIGRLIGPPLEHLTGQRLGFVLIVTGDPAAGLPLLRTWWAHVDLTDTLTAATDLAMGAKAFEMLDEYDGALHLLDQLIGQARQRSALALLPLLLAGRAEQHYCTSDWAAAEADIDESVSLSLEFGEVNIVAFTWYEAALLDAARGNSRECRERAAELLRVADEFGLQGVTIYGEAALGLLHLGLGELDASIGHLETAERLFTSLGGGDPAVTRALPNLIEAYIRAGRFDRAEEALERLDAAARKDNRTWTRACAARCRGLIKTTGFEPYFRQALELHDQLPNTFDRARTELCFAERLRRAGARSEARRFLRSALDTFNLLGAACWAERCRNELGAAGGQATKTRRAHATELTPQELQIARLVAAGSSNKEVAAALFLSTKTVEYHLSSAYRKVGVRSRTQLARVVSTQAKIT
jgi:DNA-binding CsgD family transcriptional regulator